MNFKSPSHRSASTEPEINLIPFIDVLLVVVIFLMLSTTYSKFTEVELKLPTADVQAAKDRPHEIMVSVNSAGCVLGQQTSGGTTRGVGFDHRFEQCLQSH